MVTSATEPLTMRNSELSRYFGSSSVIRALIAGACSDGLMRTAFPAAMAPAWTKWSVGQSTTQKGLYHWTHCQKQGIVEGTDDQDDALGLLGDDRPHDGVIHAEGRFFGLSPLIHAVVTRHDILNRGTDIQAKKRDGVCVLSFEWTRTTGVVTDKWVSNGGLPKSEAKASSKSLLLSFTR